MRTKRLLTIAAVLVLASISCGPAAAPTSTPRATSAPSKVEAPPSVATPTAPTPSPKPGVEQPRYGGILDRVTNEDPTSFDMHQETSPASHIPVANAYSGLVKYDSVDVDKVIPDLAERWGTSPDGATWTFHLRKNVKWHDGRPFTAEDAKYSLERMAFWKEFKINSPRGGALLVAVKGVQVIDENTIRVDLKYPSSSFFENIATGWVLIHPKHVIEAKGNMKRDVVGTGPFVWKGYSPGTSMELTKNPNYFLSGRPYLDGIRIFIIRDAATRLAAFRTGRVKMTFLGSAGLTHAEAEIVKKQMADTAVVRPYATFTRYMFLMRVAKAPWNDVRVRKAIDLAFDRQAALKINLDMGNLGAAMQPKGPWGIPEEEMKQRPGYRQPKDQDLAEAKRLMAEAGYPTGFKTTILLRTGGAAEKIGILAKDQIAKIGIDAEVDLKELGIASELYARRAFEIAATTFGDPSGDPDVVIGAYYGTGGARNYGDFSDAQVDEMFEKQARTMDTNERKKTVRQIQERLLELAPYPVIYWEAYNMGHWKEVRGYNPGTGVFSHNSLVDTWVAK